MKLLLIRHGESEANILRQVTGSPHAALTELGLVQSTRLGNLLKKTEVVPDLVYVSAMMRAKLTARLVFPFHSYLVNPAFNEVDAGSVAEWPRAQFDAQHRDFWNPFDPRRPFPGGESHQDLQDRVVQTVQQLLNIYTKPNALIAIVAHAGTISSLFHWLFSVPMQSFSRFVVDNASATLLEWDEQEPAFPHLRFFNFVPSD